MGAALSQWKFHLIFIFAAQHQEIPLSPVFAFGPFPRNVHFDILHAINPTVCMPTVCNNRLRTKMITKGAKRK